VPIGFKLLVVVPHLQAKAAGLQSTPVATVDAYRAEVQSLIASENAHLLRLSVSDEGQGPQATKGDRD